MRLDERFHGTLVKNKNGREIPEDEIVVFFAEDDAFLRMLQVYSLRVAVDGVGQEQRKAVLDLIVRVEAARRGEFRGEILDLKVHGTLVRDADGEEVDSSTYVVFRPHDNSFLPCLELYREDLAERGASLPRLAEIDELVKRIRAWRDKYPYRCKVPDVEPGELR